MKLVYALLAMATLSSCAVFKTPDPEVFVESRKEEGYDHVIRSLLILSITDGSMHEFFEEKGAQFDSYLRSNGVVNLYTYHFTSQEYSHVNWENDIPKDARDSEYALLIIPGYGFKGAVEIDVYQLYLLETHNSNVIWRGNVDVQVWNSWSTPDMSDETLDAIVEMIENDNILLQDKTEN